MGTTYTSLANLPVPDENAADDVPAWFGMLADQLDTSIVLYATSTSDRDSRYFQAPSGVICVIRETGGAIDAVYIKTSGVGTSTWLPIWTAPASSVWTPLSLVAGIVSRQVGTYDPQIRMENSEFAIMAGALAKDDGTAITNGTIIAYLPQGFTIPRSGDFPIATNTNALGSTASETAKISLAAGTGSLTFFGPANITWVGIEGFRFSTVY